MKKTVSFPHVSVPSQAWDAMSQYAKEDPPVTPKVGHVIDFSPTGEVQAMHNDSFDLGFLGDKSVKRATDIKFCEETQDWAIMFAGPRGKEHDDAKVAALLGENEFVYNGADGFKTYEGARQVEIAWLNSCRLEGVKPLSPRGYDILAQVRGELGL